ncbi:MAG: hypothetical protein ABI324_01795 [Ktedonobacteraceae bacterium]
MKCRILAVLIREHYALLARTLLLDTFTSGDPWILIRGHMFLYSHRAIL